MGMALPRKVVKTNDGVALSVIDTGVGRPFVILPAWTSSAQQYQATILDLARDWRVVAVDMRSHGFSEKTRHGHRIGRYAAWIARLIPRAQLVIFEENEGGSHFMCFENPSRFIEVVRSFLNAS